METFITKYVNKIFEKNSNLKCCKFSKGIYNSKSLLLSREKFHRLTYIFMAKFILVIYNLCGKIFGNLSLVEVEPE